MKDRFKKHDIAYQELLSDIEILTKEHCSFFGKENPLKYLKLGKDVFFEIKENCVLLSWKQDNYCFLEDKTEIETLEIPFDEKIFKRREKIKELYAEKRILEEEKVMLNILVNAFHRNKSELLRLSGIFEIVIDLDDIERKFKSNIEKKNNVYKKLEDIDKEIEKLSKS